MNNVFKKGGMHNTKKELLHNINNPPYFKIFSIKKIYPDTKNSLKFDFLNFAKTLGKIRYQNSKKDKIIEIKPDLKKIRQLKSKKTKIKSVLRYHQTNLGGSIHSDGPQHSIPPKYIMMACEQNSLSGGDTVLVDSKKVCQHLKLHKPEYFRVLSNKIFFERRGFNFKNDNVFSKPVFDIKKKKFIFRYLRDYIEKGYIIKKKKISKDLSNAFNYLDNLLKNKKFMKKIKLKRGHLILLNNHILAHGRTTFKISKKLVQRKLYRIWIN